MDFKHFQLSLPKQPENAIGALHVVLKNALGCCARSHMYGQLYMVPANLKAWCQTIKKPMTSTLLRGLGELMLA